MSMTPPDPPKREPNATIIAAAISAIAAVTAAAIPIVSSVVKSSTPSSSTSSVASTASQEIGQNNLADKAAHYITLAPYAGDSYTPVQDAYFRSPKDAKKWIRLTITQRNHNQVVTLSGMDFDSESKSTDIYANDVNDGRKYEVKTKNFTIHANVRVAETSPDLDKTAPLAGKVFQKLELRIDCDDHS